MWDDFVNLTAIELNAFQQGPERDRRVQVYEQTLEKYNDQEKGLLQALSAELVKALEENPEQDFLGQIFMELELNDGKYKGQIFTPYSLAEMMARAHITDESIAKAETPIVVCDSSVGAGCTLIAARNELARRGISSDMSLFVGQDISHTAGLMAYIQLSLLGCAGYIAIGDSLKDPLRFHHRWLPVPDENIDLWVMPMMFSPGWAGRIQWAYMTELFSKDKTPPKAIKAEKTQISGTESASASYDQMTLF